MTGGTCAGVDWVRFANDWAQFENERPPDAPDPFELLSEAMCGTRAMGGMLSVRPLRDPELSAGELQKYSDRHSGALRDVRLGDPRSDTVCLELTMDRNTHPSSYLLCPRTGSADARVQFVRRAYL